MANIVTIDCNYMDAEVAAAFLLPAGNTCFFIETGTNHSVPFLIDALHKSGYKENQVSGIFITHVHLDHAGGVSALAKIFPEAKIFAHPKAVRHIVNPSRLIEGTKAVYGEALYNSLYGEIVPVEESRVFPTQDNESLMIGNRKITFLHTQGHANHHVCFHDSQSNAIFSGDMFGISYPFLRGKNDEPSFIFPSTTPTDFDPEESRQSVKRILECHPSAIYLTHFGKFMEVDSGGNQLINSLTEYETILNELTDLEMDFVTRKSYAQKKVRGFFERKLKDFGLSLTPRQMQIINGDIAINSDGLVFQAEKRIKKNLKQ